MDRRDFLMNTGAVLATSSALLAMIGEASAAVQGRTPADVARDEDFWLPIQQAYNVDPRYILLNAGGSNPCPRGVHETRHRWHDYVNASPNINTMRSDLPATVSSVRRRLTAHINADSAEVALTRNTTEGLNIFIASLDLQPGDEILCSNEEYHVTEAAMRTRERRDRARVVRVSWTVPARSSEQIVAAFRAGFTPRTKAVVFCQVHHVGGQIMPVREICAEARQRGIPTCIDGALGFGHILTDVKEMGCDYYAASLHKYLSAPLGTGLFYVRRPLIASTWPLYGLEEDQRESMLKFESVGTRPMADFATVASAIDFYDPVGPARKQARLHYLKSYWMERVRDEPRLRFSVLPSPEHSCASVIVSVEGVPARELNRLLADRHRVWCYGPVRAGPFEGVYVAPNLFTRIDHLDRLVSGLREIARSGSLA
ncbi:MAG TPA: aminotransferase class V-fold PLP-dependent enzyme [Allosphingosinicella sp.]|nr:aminotransferase class V-fold PLP-dependent enzyme [Allosphingosinicella sp.]